MYMNAAVYSIDVLARKDTMISFVAEKNGFTGDLTSFLPLI